ncbi:hypothetical protein A4F85_04590 [Delftia sp. GW456-R20]|nr:hypothetical protein A4F85_04590 [Delftia sp. GW456-R20]
MNDTAVARDSTWVRIKTVAESTARARDMLLYGLMTMVVETAVASEQYVDRVTGMLAETAHASEQYLQSVKAAGLVQEHARGADVLVSGLRLVLDEHAHGADELAGAMRTLLVESASASDMLVDQRQARQLVQEKARARDALIALQTTRVTEQARGTDLALGHARVLALVSEHAAVSDAVIEHTQARSVLLIEKASASGEAFGRLQGRDLVMDAPAVGWDELVSQGALQGQAWTADARNWAMSRWAPFGFTGLAVIDGSLYATAPDGVYALDGADETMVAEVRTGLIDMTGKQLALPVESHIEYELRGTATLGVTQTQTGTPKTFTYPLKARPVADALTNARFEFGRGLQGRHFAYTLRLTGQQAYINDWTVIATASTRSI